MSTLNPIGPIGGITMPTFDPIDRVTVPTLDPIDSIDGVMMPTLNPHLGCHGGGYHAGSSTQPPCFAQRTMRAPSSWEGPTGPPSSPALPSRWGQPVAEVTVALWWLRDTGTAVTRSRWGSHWAPGGQKGRGARGVGNGGEK